MIYANNINSTIKEFYQLPKEWVDSKGNTIQGFNYSSVEMQEENGFFELIRPIYDQTTQYLGSKYWDGENNNYTYKVVDRDVEEIENEQKEAKKTERNQLLKDGIIVQNIWFNEEYLTRFTLKAQTVSSNGGNKFEWGTLDGFEWILTKDAFLISAEASDAFTKIYKDYV